MFAAKSCPARPARPPHGTHQTRRISARALRSTAALAIIVCSSAHAFDVVRSAGGTTPNLADFSRAYANKAPGVGYGNLQVHHTFLETLSVRCGAPDQRVTSESFFLTVRKLSTTAGDAQHTQLKFWDRGVEHFSTTIWQPHEPVGAIKTVTYNIAGLPSPNRMVRFNDGWGMALLADRDFSFSVNDDAGVISARLVYQCGHRGAHHHGGAANAPPIASYTPPPAAVGGIRFRTVVPVGYQQPNDAPCGQPGIAFNRADAHQSSYLTKISAGTDMNCRNRGSQQGMYSRVVFLSCTPGPPQSPIRHHVNIEVYCAP